jgi:hypothetical protein
MMTEGEARSAMQYVMERYPNLTAEGFDTLWPAKMPPARQAKFDADRAELLKPDMLAAFARAIVWLEQFDARKSFNQDGTSYSLKRVAEPEIGHIHDGAFIAASVAAGFDARPAGVGSPNAAMKICRQAWHHRLTMNDHQRLAAAVGRAHKAIEEIEAIFRADPIASWPYFRRVNAVRRALSSLRIALSEPKGQRAIGWRLTNLYFGRDARAGRASEAGLVAPDGTGARSRLAGASPLDTKQTPS